MSSYRVLIAEFKHETNTFSKEVTGIQEYKNRYVKCGDEIISFFTGAKVEIGGFIDIARKEGVTLIPSIAANACPGGKVKREVFEHVKDTVLKSYFENQPIDAILLSLHGAMVLEDSQDGEGEFIETIRQTVGKDIPIMTSLDLHANITEKMRVNINGMFPFDHYPHIDMYERGCEAATNLFRMLRNEIKPVINIKKLPILTPCLETCIPPHRPFLDMAHKWEKDPRVISVSVVTGFPYADIYDAGMTVIAQTDNDPDLASDITEEIGRAIMKDHKAFVKHTTPLEQALKEAVEASTGPIVIADVSDNPGIGSPGDGTHILRKMIDLKIKNAAFALITDPETVEKSIRAGVGSEVKVALGGTIMPELLGYPIEITGIVRTIADGKFINKGPMSKGLQNDIGPSVVIDIDGIEVIVSGNRIQPLDPEIFRRMGIEPLDKKIIVVKSTLHFRAAFAPLAQKVIDVDVPGLGSQNIELLKIENVRRPVFPLDEIE